MRQDYRPARLHDDDMDRIHALERDLQRKYERDIVLVPYEKGGPAPGSPRMDVGRMGGAAIKRGATFGYAPPQADMYPTLADVQTKHDDNPDGLHRSVPGTGVPADRPPRPPHRPSRNQP